MEAYNNLEDKTNYDYRIMSYYLNRGYNLGLVVPKIRPNFTPQTSTIDLFSDTKRILTENNITAMKLANAPSTYELYHSTLRGTRR